MTVPFCGSPGPTIGIEMELTIVDVHTGAVSCVADEILERLGAGYPGGVHPRVKREVYQCTLEVITEVCTTVAQARADLQLGIDESSCVLAERGLGLVSVGMHPWAHWSEVTSTPDERHQWLIESLQWPAHRMLSHGMHVHVGVRDGDHAVAIAAALTGYLPHLLALSASSPYRHGHDTGLASVRIKVMEALPIGGLPPVFPTWAAFEGFIDAMLRARAITSVREVWWDIRPHPDFGTVEVRVCDSLPTLTESVAVAALVQCLVDDLAHRLDSGTPLEAPPDWLVRQNKWRATRHGLDARLLVDATGTTRPARDVIEDLLASLAAASRRLGCESELADVRAILDHGPSYERQRAIVAAGGTLADVVQALRRELATDQVSAPPAPQG